MNAPFQIAQTAFGILTRLFANARNRPIPRTQPSYTLQTSPPTSILVQSAILQQYLQSDLKKWTSASQKQKTKTHKNADLFIDPSTMDTGYVVLSLLPTYLDATTFGACMVADQSIHNVYKMHSFDVLKEHLMGLAQVQAKGDVGKGDVVGLLKWVCENAELHEKRDALDLIMSVTFSEPYNTTVCHCRLVAVMVSKATRAAQPTDGSAGCNTEIILFELLEYIMRAIEDAKTRFMHDRSYQSFVTKMSFVDVLKRQVASFASVPLVNKEHLKLFKKHRVVVDKWHKIVSTKHVAVDGLQHNGLPVYIGKRGGHYTLAWEDRKCYISREKLGL